MEQVNLISVEIRGKDPTGRIPVSETCAPPLLTTAPSGFSLFALAPSSSCYSPCPAACPLSSFQKQMLCWTGLSALPYGSYLLLKGSPLISMLNGRSLEQAGEGWVTLCKTACRGEMPRSPVLLPSPSA